MSRKLLLILGMLAAALPAAAQPHGGFGADGSGAPGRHPRLFISPSGEPFRGRGGLEAWFAQADADHDGAISAAEFRADADRAFGLYDADGNGVIDGLELQAYERDRVPEIAEIAFPGEGGGMREGRHGGRHARQQGHGGEDQNASQRDFFAGVGRNGASRFSLVDEPEPLLAADADVDGKVTRAEWAQATARRFAELDRGHAGKLTLEALKASAHR